MSSLIKRVLEGVRNPEGYIKQVFILTHNVYFHKEVAFHIKRSGKTPFSDETFWIVRKIDSYSYIESHENNPISTSYELLWEEVKQARADSTSTPNTLRRILEHYFRILGGVNPDTICDWFEGNKKLVCKSLFSWVNAGSHGVLDDLHVSSPSVAVDTYLEVFREIFKKSNHLPHYDMMMRNETVIDFPVSRSGEQTGNMSATHEAR